MVEDPTQDQPDSEISEPEIRKRSRISLFWVIPLITLLIAGGLGYKTLAEKGPLIQISFDSADGLEIGKTKIQYRGIEAGIIEDIGVTKDLSKVLIAARMIKEAEPYLTEGSKFWVVRPEVSLTGVTGLSTLVSGDYIGFEGGSGASKRHFEGLEEGPDLIAEKGGREFVLRTDDLDSVSDDAPLLFHGITVGKVERFELSEKREVLLHVVVDSPHESLVRENSRFWNVSGLEISAGNLLDASVRVGSLQSLIAGGIAFDNPAPEGSEAKAGMTFDLYDQAPEELTPMEQIPGLELRFSVPELHNLSVGSTLTFKGLEIGEVVGIDLSEKGGDIEIRAVVEEAYRHLVKSNSAFWLSGGFDLSLRSLLSSKQETTSVRDLLAGGITFANPPDAGEPVAARTVFKLLEQRPAFLDRESGLLVNLVSDEAHGVAADDPVLYRGLRVGKVRAVEISDDGTRINIKAIISKEHAGLVRDNSIFWNASGLHFKAGDFLDASLDIDSLATLMVGGIAFETPGDPGSQAQNGASYSLLAERPHDATKSEGQDDRLHIALEAAALGSVKSDDPVLYRELEVGKVVDVGLSEDASRVRISLVIDAPYKALVKTNTVFWNASGLHASFGLFSGAKLDVESLSALLRGGIAFATPSDGGEAVKARTVFPLHASAKDEWKTWAPHIRLPKEEPQQSAGEASGDGKSKQSAAKTSADPSSETASPPSTAEAQAAPEVTETVIRDPIPTSVTLGSGGRTSSSVLKSQLSDLGFEDIDKVEKEGNVFKLRASWEGQPLALVIDGTNGRIEAEPR